MGPAGMRGFKGKDQPLGWVGHRIIGSLKLEKTTEITKSNHQPVTTNPLNHGVIGLERFSG